MRRKATKSKDKVIKDLVKNAQEKSSSEITYDFFKSMSIERFQATESPIKLPKSVSPRSPTRIQRFFARSKSEDEVGTEENESIDLGQSFFDPFLEYWGLKQRETENEQDERDEILSIRPALTRKDSTLLEEARDPKESKGTELQPIELKRDNESDLVRRERIPENLPKVFDPIDYESGKKSLLKTLVCRKFKPDMKSTATLRSETLPPQTRPVKLQAKASNQRTKVPDRGVENQSQVKPSKVDMDRESSQPSVDNLSARSVVRNPTTQKATVAIPLSPTVSTNSMSVSSKASVQSDQHTRRPIPVIRNAFVGGNIPSTLPKKSMPTAPQESTTMVRAFPSTLSYGDMSMRVSSGAHLYHRNANATMERPPEVPLDDTQEAYNHQVASIEDKRPKRQQSWFESVLFEAEDSISSGSSSYSSDDDSEWSGSDEEEYSELFSQDGIDTVPSISAASNSRHDRYFIHEDCSLSDDEDDIISIQFNEVRSMKSGVTRSSKSMTPSVSQSVQSRATSKQGLEGWKSNRGTYGPPKTFEAPHSRPTNSRYGYAFSRSNTEGSSAIRESGRPVLRYNPSRRKYSR